MIGFFDLDDGGGSSKYETKQKQFSREDFLCLIELLKTIIMALVHEKHFTILTNEDFVVHDSYKEKTNSAHVYVPCVAAVNQAALVSFIIEILKQDPSGKLQKIIDLRAYSQGRMMRALYCCKKGSGFPMLEGGHEKAPSLTFSLVNFSRPLYSEENVRLLLSYLEP